MYQLDFVVATIEVLEIEGALPEKAVCKLATELCTNHTLGFINLKQNFYHLAPSIVE